MYEASIEMLISKMPIMYCRNATTPFDVLAEMMRCIGKQNSDPETAAHSLLLVPLWHLLNGTLQKPFEMNIFEQKRHSERSVWWGLSDSTHQIKSIIETCLNLALAAAKDNRYSLYRIKVFRFCTRLMPE